MRSPTQTLYLQTTKDHKSSQIQKEILATKLRKESRPSKINMVSNFWRVMVFIRALF
jgi:hypothetical protein